MGMEYNLYKARCLFKEGPEVGIPPGPWYHPGKWYVSPYCYEDEVRANYDLPERVYVRDITLSEGQHAKGSHFTEEGMIVLARALMEAGVTTIKQHVGDLKPAEFVTKCKKEVPGVKGSVLIGARKWTPKLKRIVDDFIDVGIYEIELHRVNLEEPKCLELFSYIKDRGVKVGAGCGNVLRVPWEEIWGYCSTVISAGAEKITTYETYSVATPEAVRYFIRKLRKAIGKKIPIHWQSHNDFGTGSACSVAAVEGGASWLDLSAAGLGDRSGNGSLEETVLMIESMLGVKTGIKLDKLWDLARLTEKESGIKRDSLKAIVGEGCYFHESASHAGRVLRYGIDTKFISSNEAFSPFIVGAKRDVRIGITSLGLIPERLKQLGLKYSDEDLVKIKTIISELWTKKNQDMSVEEFDALAKKVVKSN